MLRIASKCVPLGPIYNNSALVQVLAWCPTGDKPFITWTLVDQDHRRHIVSLGHNDLTYHHYLILAHMVSCPHMLKTANSCNFTSPYAIVFSWNKNTHSSTITRFPVHITLIFWLSTAHHSTIRCHCFFSDFADGNLKCILLNEVNEKFFSLTQISLRFVPGGNKPTLFQIMDWRRTRATSHYLNQPWSSLLTQICVTRSRWVALLVTMIITKETSIWNDPDWEGSAFHGPGVTPPAVVQTWSTFSRNCPSTTLYLTGIDGAQTWSSLCHQMS